MPCFRTPCGAFSLARLKPGGPRPVRNPQFPDGPPGLRPNQIRELTVFRELHEFARELLSLVSMRGGKILFENPTTSLTRKTQGAEACGRGSSHPIWPALQPVPTAWMPLRAGCSAPIALTSCVWLRFAPTRKARALLCQGSDPRAARFLRALLRCVRPWLMPLPRSSGLQFLWARRRYRFFSGSSFFLLVSPSPSLNIGLRMGGHV